LASTIFQVSSLSNDEFIQLVGHYNRLIYKDTVDPKLMSRGYTQEQIDLMMKSKRSTINELISCDLHFTGGLTQYEHPYLSYFLTLYERYKQGVLPFPGSTSEQPAKIIEIFNVLDQLDFEKQEKQAREQEAKTKKTQATKR